MTRKGKALWILQLALKINNTPTEQALTGNKPSVFVDFSGHATTFSVHIIPQGWKSDYDVISDAVWFRCYLDDKTNKADETLDNCIAYLKQLWQKKKNTTCSV